MHRLFFLAGLFATLAHAQDVPLPSPEPKPIPVASGAAGKNYLNISLDGLIAVGASTEPDVPGLETGGHDPAQRGFTVQNVEVVFDGAVDPYFRGQANVVLQVDADGNTNVELEEAYAVTTSLPKGLQVKAGQYLTEFGRINPTHPHTWDFVDDPLVHGRLLGPDGLRGVGVQMSWVVPVKWYSQLYVAVQNGEGSRGGVPQEPSCRSGQLQPLVLPQPSQT